MQYNCTLENIRDWNHMESFEVKAGQKLVIWIPKDEPPFTSH
jgi:LysM repeat protein